MEQETNTGRKGRIEKLKNIIIIYVIFGILVALIVGFALLLNSIFVGKKIKQLENQNKVLAGRIAAMEAINNVSKAGLSYDGEYFTNGSYVEPILADFTEDQVITDFELDEATKAIYKQSGAKHQVYLTFDDGPSIYTGVILDILKAYDVPATFFCVGKDDAASLDMYKRIVEEGHTIGMHSFSHKYREVYASKEAFIEDLSRIHDLIYDETGVDSHLYRFPGGSSNTVSSVPISQLIEGLDEYGITYFDWNISSGDTQKDATAASIAANSVRGIDEFPVSVILLHDAADKYSTVRALPDIIETILAMEDTEILPITEATAPVWHKIKR